VVTWKKWKTKIPWYGGKGQVSSIQLTILLLLDSWLIRGVFPG
jgi:hypothetical protein